MAEILLLSGDTIDKIAAGEVVERPMSVVKELVENCMDAGATLITVEIKNGGIDLIRVSDNGEGIESSQLKRAFERHATSKIRNIDDLTKVRSMGFRGEALSSISSVSQVEIISKTKDQFMATRYELDGGVEKAFEEVGAPDGTTFLVRNLFYNTPVRRKFLKQPPTEAGYVAELLERLAMSKPEISFKFIQNGQVKFHTSGNGDLKEVIYRIYGREISTQLIPIQVEVKGMGLKGFLGKPTINRSNRNFEHYFLNGRYIKSKVVSKAIEDAYKQYVMQHKFPFVVLHLEMDPREVDVNVHPTKMDVRFSDELEIREILLQAILTSLRSKDLITDVSFGKEEKVKVEDIPVIEPEAKKKIEHLESMAMKQEQVVPLKEFTIDFDETPVLAPFVAETSAYQEVEPVIEPVTEPIIKPLMETKEPVVESPRYEPAKEELILSQVEQQSVFEEHFLSEKAKESYEILGQLFDTYWVVAYGDKMYLIDQHAAHEKVKFERLMKQVKEKTVSSQNLLPPFILQVSGSEERVIQDKLPVFANLGFEMEYFGDRSFCIRAVPIDLFGCSYQVLFEEILDELSAGPVHGLPEVISEKLASMACKAAVKGNNSLSDAELRQLIDDLLSLDNPYYCPHGRPTIISMTKQEIEKKFKRIV